MRRTARTISILSLLEHLHVNDKCVWYIPSLVANTGTIFHLFCLKRNYETLSDNSNSAYNKNNNKNYAWVCEWSRLFPKSILPMLNNVNSFLINGQGQAPPIANSIYSCCMSSRLSLSVSAMVLIIQPEIPNKNFQKVFSEVFADSCQNLVSNVPGSTGLIQLRFLPPAPNFNNSS